MFLYDKKLQYPVRICNPNPRLASVIISQYGGPDGELGASLRYLSQRYSMPFDAQKALLTDIGREEFFWAFICKAKLQMKSSPHTTTNGNRGVWGANKESSRRYRRFMLQRLPQKKRRRKSNAGVVNLYHA